MIRKILGTRPKIGLALGSGAAKGMAHVGVIKALEKAGIRIDHVAGTSIGALIGAIYCSSADSKYLEAVTKDTNFKKIRSLVDIKISKLGLIQGDKLTKYLKSIVQITDFKNLKVPLTIVASDLISSKQILFEKGNIFSAIRSSISIPLVFKPVYENNRYLVDGGLVNPVPIDVLFANGCDYVIAVDLGYKGSKKKEKIDTIGIIMKSFMILQENVANLRCDRLDKKKFIMLHPEIDDISYIDFNKTAKMIKLGEEIANKNMDTIKKAYCKKIRHTIKKIVGR